MTDDLTMDQLAGEWPAWRIWTSGMGLCVCATRRTVLRPGWLEHGLSQTIITDDLSELAALLRAEAEREATF
jgi:hypothetical protein